MDSLDVNKGVAAVLVAGIAFFITGLLGDNLIFEREPAKPPVNFPTATSGAAAGPEKPAGPAPIIPLLASANVQKGDAFVHQVCTACHTVDKGGKALIGPNLWGIVGDPHDHMAGFDYSAALEKYKGQPWTYQALNQWLFDPQTYAPGTRMTYTGIKSTQQRADVIAYLRTLSDNPQPLPKPEEPTKAAETAPAPGTAAPAGNHSAMGNAAAPNSAPASSPNVIGPPGSAYNPNAQTPHAGTQAGGTGEINATPTAPAQNGKPATQSSAPSGGAASAAR